MGHLNGMTKNDWKESGSWESHDKEKLRSVGTVTCLDFLDAAIGISSDIYLHHLTNISNQFPTSLRFSDAVLCF